ncbi:hypothetical protein PCASD_05951 [Puccinia coronata f. sp. avenae]|uniref:Uncharacterized protein n=1 Tax=Puccinia coronata f. sp. avenae TaxID=200324 RepID=A0A2N5V643_9BASI|nr:hypothetical protein PCASD_05951 [Puccinia coronata f. sp. avenae]
MVKEGTQASKSTMGDSVGAASDTPKVGRFDFFPTPVKKYHEGLHQQISQESTQPAWKKTLIRIWLRISSTMSRIDQAMQDFFLKNKETYEYDSPYARYPGLTELVMDDGSIDKKVDDFFKTLTTPDHSARVAKKMDLLSQEKAANLKQSLHKLHSIREEDVNTAHMMLNTDNELSEQVRPMLPMLHPYLPPIRELAERMAIYHSKSLADDQKILLNYLPREKRYLSTVLGSMGPKNVLERWYQEAIKQKVESNEFNLHGKEAEFISQLKLIQTNLAGLASSQRPSDLFPRDKKAELAVHYNEAIRKNEDNLVAIVGNRAKLQKVLNSLDNMAYHKRFMKQLRNDLKASGKSSDLCSYKINEHNLDTIKQQAPTALKNFETYLEYT